MRDPTRDIARGVTILEMEIVHHVDALPNAPVGSGIMSFGDTVLPMFTFLTGMSRPSLRTSLTTIGLGLAYNTLENVDQSWLKSTDNWKLRPFGVLQRTGVASLLARLSPPPDRPSGFVFPVVATGLWIYLSIAGSKTKGQPFKPASQSAQTRLDQAFINAISPQRLHMYQDDHDPEGLLGVLMQSVSVWFGRWYVLNHLALDEALITSISLMSFGYMFGYAFPRTCPVSKPFWTLSFALCSSGYSLLKYTLLGLATPYIPPVIANALTALGQKSLEVYFTAQLLNRLGLHSYLEHLLAKFIPHRSLVQATVSTITSVMLAGFAIWYRQAGFSLRFGF